MKLFLYRSHPDPAYGIHTNAHGYGDAHPDQGATGLVFRKSGSRKLARKTHLCSVRMVGLLSSLSMSSWLRWRYEVAALAKSLSVFRVDLAVGGSPADLFHLLGR